MDDLIKEFSVKENISETILRELIRMTFQRVATERYLSRNLIFSLKNFTYTEEVSGESIEHKFSDIVARRMIIKAKRILSESLSHYDPVKFGKYKKDEPIEPIDDEDFEGWLNDDIDIRERDTIDYGPYCSACQQAPCMCSDRERTSTVYDY